MLTIIALNQEQKNRLQNSVLRIDLECALSEIPDWFAEIYICYHLQSKNLTNDLIYESNITKLIPLIKERNLKTFGELLNALLKKYGFASVKDAFNYMREKLECQYCDESIPYEELDDFALKQKTINNKSITSRNKIHYPLYCCQNDEFTQLHWFCNKYIGNNYSLAGGW